MRRIGRKTRPARNKPDGGDDEIVFGDKFQKNVFHGSVGSNMVYTDQRIGECASIVGTFGEICRDNLGRK